MPRVTILCHSKEELGCFYIYIYIYMIYDLLSRMNKRHNLSAQDQRPNKLKTSLAQFEFLKLETENNIIVRPKIQNVSWKNNSIPYCVHCISSFNHFHLLLQPPIALLGKYHSEEPINKIIITYK
jgi:hypothetical protein